MDSLDTDVLDRLGKDMGSGSAVSRIVSMYLSKMPAETAELHERVGSGDFADLADIAHRLKSSTAMLGATGLAGILADLEAAAKATDTSRVMECLAAFDEEAPRVEAAMRSILAD